MSSTRFDEALQGRRAAAAVDDRRQAGLRLSAKPDSSLNQSIQARAAALFSELHVDAEVVVAADDRVERAVDLEGNGM